MTDDAYAPDTFVERHEAGPIERRGQYCTRCGGLLATCLVDGLVDDEAEAPFTPHAGVYRPGTIIEIATFVRRDGTGRGWWRCIVAGAIDGPPRATCTPPFAQEIAK